MGEKEEKANELVKKYNINLKRLEEEQDKLAKKIEVKDSIDFSQVSKIAGFSNIFIKNKIISAVVVMNPELEIVEQKYFSDVARFPYIPGFRAYRELPAMMACFNLIDDKPEVAFIHGHGITHPRLGLASHFSIISGVPSVGIAESLIFGEIKEENIVQNKKIIGKVINLKHGSKPLYVSPGSFIGVNSAYELAKKYIRLPHKLPEPLHLAHKYAKQVSSEVLL